MKNALTKSLAVGIFAMLLVGCIPPPPTITLHSPFDADHARELLQAGDNTIKGSAFMRQRGGGVVSCAGSTVELTPFTQYAADRIHYLYGNTTRGVQTIKQPTFVPDSPEYWRLAKNTVCDVQGFFTFKDVADGTFFVTTQILWEIPISAYSSKKQGGTLMQQVSVRGGEIKEIVLSP